MINLPHHENSDPEGRLACAPLTLQSEESKQKKKCTIIAVQ